MGEQAPSNLSKSRWAASYNPARKVTYVSWFLGTLAYFLDKLDFTTLIPPPVETKFPVFSSEPPSAPLDPSPSQCSQGPLTSSSSAASRNPGQPIAPAAPAANPASPGSGMRVPPPWRRWRRGTPRNAKHSCATHHGKLHRHWLGRSARQTASSPVTHVRQEMPVSYRADRASGRRKLMTPAAGNPDGIESLGEKK
jgi:hypothetical protein